MNTSGYTISLIQISKEKTPYSGPMIIKFSRLAKNSCNENVGLNFNMLQDRLGLIQISKEKKPYSSKNYEIFSPRFARHYKLIIVDEERETMR